MSDYLVSVFTRSSLRCPDLSSMMPVAELEPLSASCNVTKTGPEGINWPRGFFVMQKGAGDEVIADVEDREGQLSIHDSQVREIVSFALSLLRSLLLSLSRSLALSLSLSLSLSLARAPLSCLKKLYDRL